jgi:hypothetical protein
MDIEITKDTTGELMVAQVEGLTEAGIDFVDSYTNERMVVVDAGRIVIPEEDVPALVAACKQSGMGVLL